MVMLSKKRRMKKNKTGKFIFLLASLLSCQLFYAQFPYYNSGQKSEGFKILGESNPGLITFSNGGIKLIDNTNQYSGVSLDNLSFSTEKGFILEFEFVLDRGTLLENKYGDGFSIVLFDAQATEPKIGDKGGALGYAYTKKTGNNNVEGFSQGFLGLGFDLFGNYKNIKKDYDEIRNGIVNNSDGDFIVLRGPYNAVDKFQGYPVLFAIGTLKNSNFHLDRYSGNTVVKKKGLIGQRFSLRGNRLDVSPGDVEYRKAKISLIPGREEINGELGYFISVEIVNGMYNSSIIKNYFIPKEGQIKYIEQTSQTHYEHVDLSIKTPETLKMAFTGSTGGASIRAHIRNIALSLPFSPLANDVVINDVLRNREHSIKPLYSAYGYDTNVFSILRPPNKSTLFLDKSSFRFMIFDEATQKFRVSPDPFKLSVPNVGEFDYNVNSGEVLFKPIEGIEGDRYIFYYDIKNQQSTTGFVDISAEEYRSRVTSVTLNFTDKTSLNNSNYLIINKGLKKN